MERIETSLPDVYELRPVVHRDSRGSFLETYHLAKFADLGITDTFLQDNHSISSRETLRGLHYQLRHSQAKLCRAIEGEALDVAVDIRIGSPHFGKWTRVRLSANDQNLVYIPSGFAHGFLALTETVQFLYKCSDYYAPSDEYGILWNDSALAIDWGVASPALSPRDAKNPKLADIPLTVSPPVLAQMKPTILLTGKTGQLGSELSRLLPKLGEVIAPDRSDLDLREPQKIREIMRQAKPQLIVNAAAYTAVDAAETDQANATAVNAEAPRFLALEAKNLGALIVHFSTDYVFDGTKKAPYLETDSPSPLNAYGRTKLAGEQAICDSGAAHLIFRTSWVYATHGKNFLLTILRLAAEREELRIVDDQVGSPTCAIDLAEATLRVLTRIITATKTEPPFTDAIGIYHMTAAGHTTWFEFVQAILEEVTHAPQNLPWLTSATNGRPLVARHVLPISTKEFRSPTRRPAYSVLSNALLMQTFGISLPDWRTQLARCFSSETVLPNSLATHRTS